MIAKHKIKTLTEDEFLALIGKNESREDDPKYQAELKKEQAKVKEQAKHLGLDKGAPYVRISPLFSKCGLTSSSFVFYTASTSPSSGRPSTLRLVFRRSAATKVTSRNSASGSRAGAPFDLLFLYSPIVHSPVVQA